MREFATATRPVTSLSGTFSSCRMFPFAIPLLSSPFAFLVPSSPSFSAFPLYPTFRMFISNDQSMITNG